MGMKCPACGGSIRYDIREGNLGCMHCGNRYAVDEYREDNAGKEEAGDGKWLMDRYLCPGCGAELLAPEEQTVAYCMYCGREAELLGKMTEAERPAKIVPFLIDKEGLRRDYEKMMKKAFFAPDELKDANRIEEFRGIYIPYWRTTTDLEERIADLKGTRSYSTASHDIKQYYEIIAKIGGRISAGDYDASAAFDDTIATEIAPFRASCAVPFREGYLAGFLSDAPTVSAETYAPQMDRQCLSRLKNEMEYTSGHVDVEERGLRDAIHRIGDHVESVLFPVWFLTWRKGDRVMYSVMNGQTGKGCSDIPVDYGKFFRAVGIMTLVLFAALSLFAGFLLPYQIACFSSILMYLAGAMFKGELRQIRLRESHIYDWGNDRFLAKKRLPGKPDIGKTLGMIYGGFVFFTIAFLMFASFSITEWKEMWFVFRPMAVFQVILALFSAREVIGIEHKIAYLPILLGVAAQAAGLMIPSITRPHDFWYYGLALGCLGVMLITMFVCTAFMNYMTTRPAPNFFEREEVDHGQN